MLMFHNAPSLVAAVESTIETTNGAYMPERGQKARCKPNQILANPIELIAKIAATQSRADGESDRVADRMLFYCHFCPKRVRGSFQAAGRNPTTLAISAASCRTPCASIICISSSAVPWSSLPRINSPPFGLLVNLTLVFSGAYLWIIVGWCLFNNGL